MNFNINTLFAGYKTHAAVIASIGVVWFTFIGGGMDLGSALQRTLELLSISGLRVAMANQPGQPK